MIIMNTTFVVDRRVLSRFLLWLEEVYIPAARESGIFTTPTLLKVQQEVDPNADSIALQLPAESQQEAERWHNDTAALLRDDIHARWGDAVLFFTTFMTVLPITPRP